MARRLMLRVAAAALLLAGCASNSEPADPGSATASTAQHDDQRYPDVVDVTAERTGDTFSFEVTISSPYDTPERYADGWRIVGPDGTVYGEHTLAHDHANEQPFTRVQTSVEIPGDVSEVTVEGRDQQYGYGGETAAVTVPHE